MVRSLPVLLALAVLGACGGSGNDAGSGQSNPPANPPPNNPPPNNPPPDPPAPPPSGSNGSLSVSSSTVSVQAPVNQQDATHTVKISLQNLTAPVYVGGTFSTNGIHHLGHLQPQAQGSAAQIDLIINFRNPPETAPGTYQDLIKVHACLESPCGTTHIAGSPRTISVTYTVLPLTGSPAVTLQRTSIDWAGDLMDPVAPPVQKVNVGFSNIPVGGVPFVSISNSTNAVSRAAYFPSGHGSSASGQVEVLLKTAPTVGVGEFTDVVTLRACLDAGCSVELAGSPAQFSVQYTVSDVKTGPGYRIRSLAMKAKDLVWDPDRQVIYVAIPSDATENANTIGVLDPVTGDFQSFAPVGANPRRLHLSPDGQYLYVGLRGESKIQRLALPSLTLDLNIPVAAATGPELFPWEFHTSPDSSRTLGVIRSDISNNAIDLVVYDDDVKRPVGLSPSLSADDVSSFQWDSPSRIFGFHGPGSTALHIQVDPDGVQMTASQQIAQVTDRAVYLLNGRMYTQLGQVYDAVTFAPIGTFPLNLAIGSNSVLALDPDQQKAFFLVPGSLKAFDANSREAKGSIPVANSVPHPIETRMIRWGRDGLAVLDHQGATLAATSGILLIDGTFVTQ